MDHDDSSERNEPGITQELRIDQVCLRFEQALKNETCPDITQFMVDQSESVCSELFKQLLLLNIEYQHQQGQSINAEDYLQRYSQYQPIIREVLQSSCSSQATGESGDVVPTAPNPIRLEKPGETIGPYKIMEEIGEGGMGIVFVAEQRKPVRRKVALKIIKPGMDSKEVIARFEAERQALAMMDHPNIAKVLDVGTTDSGRPYFAMELVRGLTITDYCDQHLLTTQQRLDLFVTVCHAIKHAHQKGVIHRDVKPSNVLVTLHDGKPVPKVIDFGIAKAINQQLTERTVYTRYSQLVGTPLYMSPEQAELSGLDVNTRTDIYSLGVLLYELLTGTTPFEKQRLHQAAYDEVRRIIREEEPPKPSTRVNTMGASATSVAAHRRVDVKRLSQIVRGDLDWIVMKALDKDRTRRYDTADALASDVMRHLDNKPVVASPPSITYRLRKYARRHRAAIGTAAFAMTALLLGCVVSLWQAILATQASREADQARTQAVQAFEKTKAQKSRALAAERTAKQQRNRAQQQRDKYRELLYRSDIVGALNAWENSYVGDTMRLVERHRPTSDERDLRGFEWYYLSRLCRQEMSVASLEHEAFVWSIAYSPDGEFLATTDAMGNLTLWNVGSREKRFQCKAHEGDGVGIAFAPNGQTIATAGTIRNEEGGLDSAVRLWDVGSGKLLNTVDAPAAQSPSFSPDGKILAVSCSQRVEFIDVARGELLTGLAIKGLRLAMSVAFAPDGKHLAIASAGGVTVVTPLSRQTTTLGELMASHGAVFSKDGTMIASAHIDGCVRIWDVQQSSMLTEIRGLESLAVQLQFSPDGKLLATGGTSIELWNVEDGTRVNNYHGQVSMAFSPDGQTLASGRFDSTVRFQSVEPIAKRTPQAIISTVPAQSPSLRTEALVAAGYMTGGIRVWDAYSGTVITRKVGCGADECNRF